MKVYYFTCAKWALDDIRHERLKVCRFSDLNDPFELFAGDMHNKCERKLMRGRARDIDKQYGLLCFSESWHDPLMWSHYGDRHRGICLGFDADSKILRRINYQPTRLLHSSRATTEVDTLLLTTKFARWNYEKECRVIVPLHEADVDESFRFRRFDESLRLTRVIVGPRCTVAKHEIAAALRNREADTEVIKSRLAFKTFRVVRNHQGFAEASRPSGVDSTGN